MSFTLDGHRIESATVCVPGVGPWFADVDLEGAPDVSGAVTLRLRNLVMSGTIDTRYAGTFASERRVRVVGGGGGWGTLLASKHYHNDAQVRARTVAEDAARLAGETLGDIFEPAAERIGVDYVRQAGPASRVLEDVIGGVAWWVDYDGTTNVGTRAAVDTDASLFEVLSFNPRTNVVVIASEDPSAVKIGTLVSERLDEARTVRELTIALNADSLTIKAWTGGASGARGRLERALRSAVERMTDSKLFGVYKYRVSRMTSDRVELQAVTRAHGLPDMLPVSMWPGVAGAHGDLTPGAHVLVQFIEGDRTQPIVTHFAGKDGVGWTPANLTLDATTLIKLGDAAEHFVALANLVDARLDTIQANFDSHTHVAPSGGGTTDPPTPLIRSLASVAATKVKAL